jgi:hypothetical protein
LFNWPYPFLEDLFDYKLWYRFKSGFPHAIQAYGQANSGPMLFPFEYPNEAKSDAARSGEYCGYGAS